MSGKQKQDVQKNPEQLTYGWGRNISAAMFGFWGKFPGQFCQGSYWWLTLTNTQIQKHNSSDPIGSPCTVISVVHLQNSSYLHGTHASSCDTNTNNQHTLTLSASSFISKCSYKTINGAAVSHLSVNKLCSARMWKITKQIANNIHCTISRVV